MKYLHNNVPFHLIFIWQMIFRKILQPLINIVSAGHLSFPSGGLARSVIAFKMVDVLTTVALRIGREMTREHMTGILQQFFICFELVHGENSPTKGLSSPGEKINQGFETEQPISDPFSI